MLFTGLGRSVLGETVPEVLSTAQGRRPRGGTQTEYWVPSTTEIEKFQENLTSASNLCVLKKGAFVLMLFKARDRLQTKTKHYNMIFNL